MTEDNLNAVAVNFFNQVCGKDKLIDKTDVQEGRLDKEIAKQMGIIDEDGNYTDKTYTLEQVKSKTNIESLITAARKKKNEIAANRYNTGNEQRVDQNNSEIVSQKKCKYKGKEGTLTEFADGRIEFDGSGDKNIFKIVYNNKNDFDSNHPSKTTEGVKIGNNKSITRTTTYEYHPNGKLKHEQLVQDSDGKVLRIGDYDERGGLISQEKYDSYGNLSEKSEGFWEDDNTHIIIVKDNNGNKKKKIVDKVKDGNLESKNIYNKNDVLIEERHYKDKKISNLVVYYPSGQKRRECEYFPSGGLQSIKTYSKDGKELQNYQADMIPDGKTWDKSAAQVGEGDCYLVASVNSIRKLDDGEQMLSSLIDIKTDADGKKTYTVTLPGAKIAAQGLKKDKNIDPNKMYITGTYTFTEEEFDRIAHQQGSKYSIGNANIVLLEAAFEKYREEVSRTVQENNIDPNKNQLIPGLFTSGKGLAGGWAFDAVFMLTGKPSKVYKNDNPDYSLERDALQNGEIRLVSNNTDGSMHKASPSSVEELTEEQSQLNIMLDEIMNDIKDGKKDIIATVGFRIYNSETQQRTGHALTIVDVTDKTVTITNPWYPDCTLTMSRQDFLACADMVSICDASKEGKIVNRETVGPNKNKPDSPTQNPNRNVPNFPVPIPGKKPNKQAPKPNAEHPGPENNSGKTDTENLKKVINKVFNDRKQANGRNNSEQSQDALRFVKRLNRNKNTKNS